MAQVGLRILGALGRGTLTTVVGLGVAADNVVLVAQAGVTRREDVTTALRLLKPLQRKVKAAVLTPGADVGTRNG